MFSEGSSKTPVRREAFRILLLQIRVLLASQESFTNLLQGEEYSTNWRAERHGHSSRGSSRQYLAFLRFIFSVLRVSEVN